MLLKLLLPLEPLFSWVNIFHYITFRASYAAITALLISFLLGPTVIAALAHPPILGDEEFSRFCLAATRTILWGLSKANGMARRTEPFRVLRQALGYAVSVFVAALPSEGFELLRKAATLDDRDVAWVVKENLAKKRLTKSHGAEVAAVRVIAGGRESR